MFKRHLGLQRHIDATHRRIKFCCPVAGCEAQFTRRDTISVHIRRVHDRNTSNFTRLTGPMFDSLSRAQKPTFDSLSDTQ